MGSAVSTSAAPQDQVAEITAEVHRVLAEYSLRAVGYGIPFSQLWQCASQGMLGGKLLRPRLLIGAFDALVGEPGHPELRAAAVRIAAGIELVHFSFLLHDDVIDGDILRRGRPNLIGALLREREPEAGVAENTPEHSKNLHWARTNGMLMGDLLLSAAHQVFAREPLPNATRLRLLSLLDHTIMESVAGEQLDVGLSDEVIEPDLNTVLEMSRLKTATYTLEFPLKAAAIIAGSGAELENVIGAIGRHVGTAFQLQDDLFSTFGSAEEHGKDAFSDLREGKETAIIAYARTTSSWPSIEPRFGRGYLDEADGYALRKLLAGCGAEEFIRSLIDDRLRACFELVGAAEPALPSGLGQFIRDCVASLEERRS